MSLDLGNLAHIRDINLNAFNGAVNRDGSMAENTATVKVNHNTFAVRILGDRVDVSFTSGNAFTNLFRGNTLQRAQQQLQLAYDESVARAQRGTTTESAAQFTKNGSAEVVQYGFSDLRDRAVEEVREVSDFQANSITTIDLYNQHIGIGWNSVSAGTMGDIVDGIRNGTLTITKGGMYSADKLGRWVDHLRQNIGKLDVFQRISDDIALSQVKGPDAKRTGWAGVFRAKGTMGGLEELVRKNLTGGDIRNLGLQKSAVKVFAGILKKMVELDTKGMTSAEADRARAKILEDEVEKVCPQSEDINRNCMIQDAFNNVIRSIFFRQTSKLGLSFMNKEKTPVMFQWRNHDGKDVSSQDISNKWWKAKSADITKQYGASITYSEMRFVQRHNFDNVHLVRSDDPAKLIN